MRKTRSPLAAARKYLRWGWKVLPVPPRKKGCRLKGWPRLRLRESDLSDYFDEDANIAILTGEPSGRVDVDLDCPEALALASAFLPATGRIYGRKTAPRSHWLYRPDSIPSYEKFCDTDRGQTCLLELLSTGHQALVPPSIHPSGERLRWQGNGRSARVDAKELLTAVRKTAAAVLFARHWPERGRRDEAAMALAGTLLRAGSDDKEVGRFVSSVARAAGDEEYKARKDVGRSTRKRLDSDREATGRPRLAEITGKDVVDRASEWLGIRAAPLLGRGTQPEWPAPLAAEASYGLAGEAVRAIEPRTEADPAALLVQILTMFGNVVGPSPHFEVEAAKHGANLFCQIVGKTSRTRKGTSWAHGHRIFRRVDALWADKCVATGLSSGEGVIWAVRDPIEKRRRTKRRGKEAEEETVVEDEGVEDKRLMVYEPEFAGPLRAQRREGNTLSALLRQAWESGTLRTLTKNLPVRATGAHISIVSHITQEELRRELTATDQANGFANRFLFVCAKRSKHLPLGGRIDAQTLEGLASRFEQAVRFARTVERMRFTKQGKGLWYGVYPRLTADLPGLLGAVVARAEAQVLRLSVIYSLLDSSQFIATKHLNAALAVWRYCQDSARYIFSDALGDPVADAILRRLRKSPKGLTRTEIREIFSRNRSESEIENALQVLLEHKLIQCEQEETGGRPAERWFATQ